MNVVIDSNIQTNQIKNETADRKISIFLYTYYYMCILILLSVPISEIVIGILNKDALSCDSGLFMNLDTWLITKGSVECFIILCIPLLFVSNKQSIVKCTVVIIIYLFNIFTIIWIISGSVIFFRDCSYNLPDNLYYFIIFILVFGYIGVINIFIRKNEILSSE